MLRTTLKRFARDASGATAIEYALIASIVSVSIVGALRAVSGNLQTSYDSVASAVQPAD